MLVNRTFYVFLGATNTEKCRQFRYSIPAEVVLSLSSGHYLFINDKIYSENSKRFSVVGLQKAGVDKFAS